MLERKRGYFVTIEGLDAAGKFTQADMLMDKLTGAGTRFSFTLPRYEGEAGYLIRDYLKGAQGGNSLINRRYAAMLFALDRLYFAPHVKNYLEQGYFVLGDRGVYSNVAYNAFDNPELERWILELEYRLNGWPIEDLIIYLRAPVATVRANILARNEQRLFNRMEIKRDIHEENFTLLSYVARKYEQLAQSNPDWVTVNVTDPLGAMRTKEEIHEDIMSVLRSRRLVNV